MSVEKIQVWLQLYSTTRQFCYNCTLLSGSLVTIVHYYQTVWLQLYTTIGQFVYNCTVL